MDECVLRLRFKLLQSRRHRKINRNFCKVVQIIHGGFVTYLEYQINQVFFCVSQGKKIIHQPGICAATVGLST